MATDGQHVIKPIPGGKLPSPLPDRDDLLRRHAAVQALSWWRIMRGKELPDASTPAAEVTVTHRSR